ncbi:hypothetical protein Lferr_2504 [Acidithiobacillus ferrooxidans ATCC 53993]|jgi:hypothetical protein|uniref:Uncharacterized protein n=1 Tax=Acidithiobacillus ferrooxidans (strain ATCC 23270 / DSM 14882 / CIP 104768 / NCIMB 8455) TaxID=243159 RepID=B7J976_ACIF2|nr:hypothetical protein Lferr_2504 [Acidithiobacillus ferrooxidans ATCC 53993]ACK80195.1 hypothetical protein AFE_2884 [Acidithiobacillus ferrooxidans ATCC 23270]
MVYHQHQVLPLKTARQDWGLFYPNQRRKGFSKTLIRITHAVSRWIRQK